MIDKIIEKFPEEEFLKADGFDDAIIGVEYVSFRLIYSYSKCINMLMETMTMEEAYEHMDYNVLGSHVGAKTPIWCFDDFE